MSKIVIVQGRYHNALQEVIDSIRCWFDGRIILSSWAGESVNLNNIDDVVLLDDPGYGPIQNINRQIYGVYEILNRYDFKDDDIIFRTRNDILFKKNVFDFWKMETPIDRKLSMFDSKLMISCIMSMNPESPPEYRRLNPSDWFHLGFYKDMFRHFDLFSNMIIDRKYCCEQLWFINEIFKYLNINSDDIDIDLQWKLFINNFQIVNNNRSLDSHNLKFPFNKDDGIEYIDENVMMNKTEKYYG